MNAKLISRVLILTGRNGVGKSFVIASCTNSVSAALHIRRELRSICGARAEAVYRNSMERRSTDHLELMASKLTEIGSTHHNLLIEGVLWPEEIHWFRRLYASASVIWIEADTGTRVERVMRRECIPEADAIRTVKSSDLFRERLGLHEIREMANRRVNGACDRAVSCIGEFLVLGGSNVANGCVCTRDC